jgi:serine/threonine-protein kinase
MRMKMAKHQLFSFVLTLITFLATVGVSPAVQAQASNNAAAQTLFDTARALMKKGNYAEACPKLEESQRLDPGSGTLLNLGVCYEHLGLTASAWTTFIDAAASAKAAGKADRMKSAQQHADALAPRLARITIRVTVDKIAGLEVRRDGTIIRPAQWGTAIAADPGPHTIAVTAPGYNAWQTTVTLHDAKSETVTVPELALAPPVKSAKAAEPVKPKEGATAKGAPAPADSAETNPGQGQRTVALVAGGIGIVGVAVGTVFGFRSKSAHDDAAAYCNGTECTDPRGVELSNKARTAGNVSTAAFILGSVGLAAAGVLWFTAPQSNVEVGLGIGTMQIAGTW